MPSSFGSMMTHRMVKSNGVFPDVRRCLIMPGPCLFQDWYRSPIIIATLKYMFGVRFVFKRKKSVPLTTAVAGSFLWTYPKIKKFRGQVPGSHPLLKVYGLRQSLYWFWGVQRKSACMENGLQERAWLRFAKKMIMGWLFQHQCILACLLQHLSELEQRLKTQTRMCFLSPTMLSRQAACLSLCSSLRSSSA